MYHFFFLLTHSLLKLPRPRSAGMGFLLNAVDTAGPIFLDLLAAHGRNIPVCKPPPVLGDSPLPRLRLGPPPGSSAPDLTLLPAPKSTQTFPRPHSEHPVFLSKSFPDARWDCLFVCLCYTHVCTRVHENLLYSLEDNKVLISAHPPGSAWCHRWTAGTPAQGCAPLLT